MVKMIKEERRLAPYLHKKIEDAGVEVEIDCSLSDDDYAAVKVDDYYAGQGIDNQPKAVDFVVSVDCVCDWFALYILELKDVKSPRRLDIAAIQEKFSNTINLFLSTTFKHIFLNDRFKYRAINLYIVSDVYKEVGKYPSHAAAMAMREKLNKKDTLRVDLSLSEKHYQFRGKILRIQYDIPPNPIIRRFL